MSVPRLLLVGIALAPAASAQVRVYVLGGDRADLRLGASVASAGDVDLDGVPDFLAGSDPSLPDVLGRVDLVSGRTGHVLRTLASRVPGDGFGAAVVSAGDLDSDGVPDVVVGCPREVCHDATHLGAVRAYSGRDGSLLWLVRCPATFAATGFGNAIADLGDVDGDGIDDLVVGPCTDATGGGHQVASVRVLSGRDGSLIRFIRCADSVGGNLPSFGSSVAGPGDVDGDGVPDVLVGAPYAFFQVSNSGSVFLWSGRSGAFLRRIDGTVADARFGTVGRAGDVDQDGIPDFLIGAPRDSTGGVYAGSVSVFSGRDASLLRVLRGNTGEEFGTFLAGGVDVNGDGIPDLAVGAPFASVDGHPGGAVRVYSGRDGSLLTEVRGERPSEEVGPCALIGDLNGDSIGDLVLGAPGSGDLFVDSGSARAYVLGWEPPRLYCRWKWNSQDCGSSPTTRGAPSLSIGSGMTVHVGGVLNRMPGYLAWGLAAADRPFGGGTLCLVPLARGPVQDSGGSPAPGTDCTGSLSFQFARELFVAHGLAAGTRVFCQFVYRDSGFAPPDDVGLSEGLAFTVLP
jgi:hypothetical protein